MNNFESRLFRKKKLEVPKRRLPPLSFGKSASLPSGFGKCYGTSLFKLVKRKKKSIHVGWGIVKQMICLACSSGIICSLKKEKKTNSSWRINSFSYWRLNLKMNNTFLVCAWFPIGVLFLLTDLLPYFQMEPTLNVEPLVIDDVVTILVHCGNVFSLMIACRCVQHWKRVYVSTAHVSVCVL